LEIIFSTKSYNQKVSKRPRITTNEGPPDKNVSITAEVIQRPDSTYPIVIRPYKLDISQFSEKVRDKMKFTIVNSSESEVALNLIAGIPDFATIDLPKKIKAGQSASGELKLLPSVLGKSFTKSFTIEVTGETTSRFTVPVKRTVKGPAADTTSQTEKPVAH
jgi:hypothetical protein